jgi:glycosyltransferase involved in cell wall biosynthesis
VDRERQLKNTQEINQFIRDMSSPSGFKKSSLDNLRSLVMTVRPPLSMGLYKSLLEARNYDIYHAFGISLSSALYAYQASLRNGIPLVISPSFHPADKLYYNSANIKILKHARAIIALTEAETEIFGKFGIDTAKIKVVGCGVDFDTYSNVNLAEVEKIRAVCKFNDYDLNILFISRLQKEKGLFDVMDAVIQLNGEGKKIQLLVAGADFATNSLLIKEAAAKYSFIKYLGHISEEMKIHMLHACDALVVPSIVDSFGIVYIEAWACKKPVIGADIPSTRSLISYGEDGFYVEYGDRKALANKIRYFANNSDSGVSMGKRGYEKVKEKYTDREIFDNTYQIYAELCNNKGITPFG